MFFSGQSLCTPTPDSSAPLYGKKEDNKFNSSLLEGEYIYL